jgi:Na+-translocating ferredoxin:NAD+ oxidoreductase RnfC subunit
LINKCPNNIEPLHSGVTKSQTVAHFKLEDCCNCELCNQCPVKLQKKDAVVRINLNSIKAAEVRAEIKEEQKENTSMRAAIEGTNSALKRSQGLGKLRVRGGVKCQIVVGFKVIAQNIKRVCNVLLGKMPKPRKSLQGITMPI